MSLVRSFIFIAALFLPRIGYCAGLFPSAAFSDGARGTTAAGFLKTPPSARFEALALAGATLRSPDSIFHDPAGAMLSPDVSALSLSYESMLERSGRTGFAFVKGLKDITLGLGAVYNYHSGLDKYDDLGAEIGGFNAYDAAFIGSAAKKLSFADAGVALKYIRSKLYDSSADSVAMDIGFIFRASGDSKTDLGISVRNFGLPMKLGSETAPLPLEITGAMAWRYAPQFTIMTEGKIPVDHAPYIILAGEYVFPLLSAGPFLRAGLNFKNYDDLGMMGAFSTGFGFKFGSMLVDYAFVPYGDLGVTHRITLGMAFMPPSSSAAPPVRGVLVKTELPTIAVVTFDRGEGASEAQAQQVSDMLEAELLKTGRFQIVERTKTDFITAEKKMSYSGLSQSEAASELARQVGAKGAVFGIIAAAKQGWLINAKIIDAFSNEILVFESEPVAEDYQLKDAVRNLAEKLSSKWK